jgi:hypothetical protein
MTDDILRRIRWRLWAVTVAVILLALVLAKAVSP